jgi:hypothetical protein
LLGRWSFEATKLKYLLTDAVFPYLKETALAEVRDAKWFALQIDEANIGFKVGLQTKYLGIVFRYMPKDAFKPNVVCLDLPDLPSTSAEQIASAVYDAVEQFGLKKDNCLAVMSDSCNAMRGAKSGTVVRLKTGGFPNLIDLGGCSLHHIANVAKHACAAADLGAICEEVVKDIYCHFKYSSVEPGQ